MPRAVRSRVLKLACVVLAGALAGCSEYSDYVDRRDTIALSGGNAIAADRVTETVDPWSPASANRNIAFAGTNMQRAVQRYRTGQVIAPVGTGTSATYGQSGGNNNGPSMQPDPTASPAPPPKSP